MHKTKINPYTPLLNDINRYVSLSQHEEERLIAIIKTSSIKRKQYIFQPGVFTTSSLYLELGEMNGNFQLSGAPTQYIVSGGTATITEADNMSYLISIERPTSSLLGGVLDSMRLSIVVPR